MALALYRKYRPAKFAEVVGQEHVTEPLSRAIEAGRINHAYLFSGPRGCGKTSSARILARSLNCELGPTPEPCGVCSSCVSLAPGGPGNIDVTELDAASHGGVDDTRELRDRAFFAPAESRYRVFIVDEAHMITTQGFNALLKIVEEPPEHLVFVFATTEPEKVLPTIRSRTHHYPFRLIPPGTLRKLLERICAEEEVAVAAAVYPLVIRAGAGSARDSLSVLDQLVSGAGPEGVTYERAVALLGVTDVSLIDDVVDALAAGDRAAVFEAVDRLVEAGHDPRRFATDLLQRLRDLTLLQAVPEAVGRGIVEAADDEVSRMVEQAGKFGAATLTRYGEILHTGLTEMRGATAPRLLLELLCARMLLPAATTAEPGLLERLERLERRSAIAAGPPAPGEAGDDAEHVRQFDRPSTRPVERGAAATGAAAAARPGAGGEPDGRVEEPVGPRSGPTAGAEHSGLIVVTRGSGAGAEQSKRVAAAAESGPEVAAERGGRDAEACGRGVHAARSPLADVPRPGVADGVQPTSSGPTTAGAYDAGDMTGERSDQRAAGELGAADVRRVWQEIQDAVKQRKKRTAALLVSATVRAVEHDTLVLSIGTAPLARLLSEQSNTDVIAEALHAVLGVRWRVRCEHGDGPAPQARESADSRPVPPPPSSGRPVDGGRSTGESAGTAPVGGQGSSGGPRAGASGASGSSGEPESSGGPAAAGDGPVGAGAAGARVASGVSSGAGVTSDGAGAEVVAGGASGAEVGSGRAVGGASGVVAASGGDAVGFAGAGALTGGPGGSGGALSGAAAVSSPAAAPPGGPRSAPAFGGSVVEGGSPSTSATSRQSLPGQAPSGGVASGGVAAGRTAPVGAPASGVAADRSTGGAGSAGRPQFERRSVRSGRRSTRADDGVPLPPEPPDEDVPPDDEEALLAEIDAGVGGHQDSVGSDPEAAAIALLTKQLGARAINPR